MVVLSVVVLKIGVGVGVGIGKGWGRGMSFNVMGFSFIDKVCRVVFNML